MNKPLACATLCALASCLANAETYTWIGKNGSLTGSWEDAQCWQGGRRPDVNAEDSVISGNRYSAIYLPRSNQDYTITLGEDEFLTNCLMQVVSGSGMGGTITITGHGKKLTTRKANGPGVNNICMANAKLRFVDVDVELRGCNAVGGEIIVGNGANFTTGGYALYCNTDNSHFTVEDGGNAQVSAVDNRGYSNVITVNGGVLDVLSKYDPLNLCKGSQLIVNRGMFTASTVQFAPYGASSGMPNGAKCEINGGTASISTLSFGASSTNSIFAITGGTANVTTLAIAAPNEIRVEGGTLYSGKPDMTAFSKFAKVTFNGGVWTLPKKDSELLTYEDHPLLPQGEGVLNVQTDSSNFNFGYGIALLSSEQESVENPGIYMTNALFSGTIQVTNRNARTDFYTRGGDATMTVGKRGKLIVPVWSARAKGSTDEKYHHRFDLELFALTYGCYVAQDYVYNDFVNGVTIGANGDWDNVSLNAAQGTMKSGHISRFVFNDYVTFDTKDYFNKTDTHKIGIYKADVNVTNLTVRGGGEVTLVMRTGGPANAGQLSVEEGSALDLPGAIGSAAQTADTLSSTLIAADKVLLGPNSKLTLHAGRSTLQTDGFVADETSAIEVNCPVNMESGVLQTCLSSKSLDQCPRIAASGPYAEGWTLKNVAGVIYLADGNTSPLPVGSKPYAWSGAVSGNFSDAGNWFGGNAPSTSSATANELVFAGTRNTVITNDMTSATSGYLSIFNLQFAKGCGPIELHGNPLLLNPTGYGGATAAIYDESEWPVAIYCDLARPNAKCGLLNFGGSVLHVMGDLDVGTGDKANIYVIGDVRLGGTVTAGSIIYFLNSKYENNLKVVSGGSVTLSRPDVIKQANQYESTGTVTLTVDEGCSFTTSGDLYDPGNAKITHVINGTASILGGLAPTCRDQRFTGRGTLFCGESYPTANTVTRTVTLSGGLTFAPTGDWKTLTAQNVVHPLVIRVEGDVIIAANADWTYGASDVVSASATEDRALVADVGSVLTFAATDYVTKLADPVVSDGTVVFEEGAKVEPTGTLYDTNWKTFVQAKDIVGMPAVSEKGKYRIVEDDGCRCLQFKARGGFVLYVR